MTPAFSPRVLKALRAYRRALQAGAVIDVFVAQDALRAALLADPETSARRKR